MHRCILVNFCLLRVPPVFTKCPIDCYHPLHSSLIIRRLFLIHIFLFINTIRHFFISSLLSGASALLELFLDSLQLFLLLLVRNQGLGGPSTHSHAIASLDSSFRILFTQHPNESKAFRTNPFVSCRSSWYIVIVIFFRRLVMGGYLY